MLEPTRRKSNIFNTRVLIVLLLSAGTLLFFNLFDRYQVSGDELLVNNNFQQAFSGWKKAGTGVALVGDDQPIVHLTSTKDQGIVAIKQWVTLIKNDQLLRFSGAMKTEGIEQADRIWRAARLIYVGHNSDGESIRGIQHVLAARYGTTDWEYFSEVFIADSNAVELRIEAQLVDVKGSMWVKRLSLQPVSENPMYKVFWTIDVMLWVAIFFWLLAPYVHMTISSVGHALVAILLLGVMVGILIPSHLKSDTGNMLQPFIPGIDDISTLFQIGHFLSFTLLSLVVLWKTLPRNEVFMKLGLLILFAMVTEILQFLVDGRTPQVWDFFADVAGIGVALIISNIYLRITVPGFHPWNK